MQEPNFWNDASAASETSMEAKDLKDRIEKFKNLEVSQEELEILLQMSIEEDDESSFSDIKTEYKRIVKVIEDFKIQILLSGEYDRNSAILSLHTGAGGNDAQDWTEMLYRMYSRWCEAHGYKIEVLDYVPDTEAGIKAVTIKITGEYVYGYLKAEKGVHRLVRISPYNSNGKRQTSFASCEVIPELTKEQDIEINNDDLRIDTYRSGGAGGQHVNTSDSAVRITHLPTGIVVQCQNERSQHTNKDIAMRMLKAKLVELKERAHKEKIEDLTGELKDIGWGSQIRSYVFHPYNLVKDHRTGVETANINGVMDGNLDQFIFGFLRNQKK